MFTHVSALAVLIAALVLCHVLRPSTKEGAIPWAKSTIPILGNALEYGSDPLRFLLKQKQTVGEVFRVNLLLMKVTFVIGPRVRKNIFSSSAVETKPLFGVVEPLVVERDARRRCQRLSKPSRPKSRRH